MAASYISVPRDLTKVKSKVMFNLTKRQLICFSVAALIGVPSFFLIKQIASTSTAAIGMMVIMMPFFFLAMYEKNGQHLEVILGHLIEARTEFPLLTENIMLLHESPKPYYFSNEADLLNRIALGKTAKQVREEHGLKPGTSIRPYLTTKQIEAIDRLQRVDIGLLVSTPDFQERKRYLEWYFMKKLQ